MPYFLDHKYQQYDSGDVVELLKKDGWIAKYKITKAGKWSSWGSDLASFDDGKEYSLTFHSLTKQQ